MMTLAQRLARLDSLEKDELRLIGKMKGLSARQKEIERQRTRNNYEILRESVKRTYG